MLRFRQNRKIQSERLEDRILLSATWMDADTGMDIGGPTDGDDIYRGESADEIGSALGGDGTIGSLDYTGGAVDGGAITVNGDLGELTIGHDLTADASITEDGGIEETLEQIKFQVQSLTEPGLDAGDSPSLEFELIREAPSLEIDTNPLIDAPPPSEQLSEIVETTRSEQGSSVTEKGEAQQSIVVTEEPEVIHTDTSGTMESQFSKIFGLIRSLGPLGTAKEQGDSSKGGQR